MSWDVLFQDLPAGIASIAEIPDDFVPGPLGPRSEVIARIRARIPEVDFRDPSWGRLEGPAFSIELNLGEKEVADSLMLHVRGDAEALGAVSVIAEALDRRALDCSEGELIDFDSPDARAGLEAWRAYRDGIVSGVRR